MDSAVSVHLLRVSTPLIMIERRRRRHRCFGGGKSKVASVAAVLKSMRLGRSIVTLERFLAEIKTRRECEEGYLAHGREGPWVRFVMPSKCRDERPSPPSSTSISEDEALLARGNGKADEKIACITHAHDFQTSKGG